MSDTSDGFGSSGGWSSGAGVTLVDGPPLVGNLIVNGLSILNDGSTISYGTVQIGQSNGQTGTEDVAASPASIPTTLDATQITLGNDPIADLPPSWASQGTLNVSGGSVVNATGLVDLLSASAIGLDAASSLVIGPLGVPVGGSVVIMAGGTLSGDGGTVAGNVTLGGLLDVVPLIASGILDGGTIGISGSLTGSGTAAVVGKLEIGDASGFTGTFDLFTGTSAVLPGTLVLDHGGAPNALLQLNYGRADLRDVAYASGEQPNYQSGTGLLIVGADTLDVGAGLSAADFILASDGLNGTMISGPSMTVGGTLSSSFISTLTLDDGGVWSAGGLEVAQFYGGPGVLAVAASSARVPTTLDAGAVGLGQVPDFHQIPIGVLTITGGSLVRATALYLTDMSAVSLDATSKMVIGTGTPLAGQIVVGSDGAIGLDKGSITANLSLDGTLDVHPSYVFNWMPGNLLLAGSLSGNGSIGVNGQLDVADATAFTGAFSLDAKGLPGDGFNAGGTLIEEYGGSSLPNATLTMNWATVILRGITSILAPPSYDAGSGQLRFATYTINQELGQTIDGTTALNVGFGQSASDFSLTSDSQSGTVITEHRLPVWIAPQGSAAGDWSDPTHWSTGNLPLATDTVAIGFGLTEPADWTVTATNEMVHHLFLDMGAGSLAVTGSLSVSNLLLLTSGTLTTGGSIAAGQLTQTGGLIELAGGSLDAAQASVSGAVTLESGATWSSTYLTLTPSSAGILLAGSSLTGPISLNLTGTGTATAPLDLTAGSTLSTAALLMNNGVTLLVDGSSVVDIGAASIVEPGSIDIGFGGLLYADGADKIGAGIVDQGGTVALGAANFAGTPPATGASITGSLSGSGMAIVYSADQIASAESFTGTVQVFGALTLDAGSLPNGTLEFLPVHTATVDLRGVAWQGEAASYTAATGQLAIGTTTLDVGVGLTGTTFAATADGSGGTSIVATNVACYAAGTRIRTPGGDVAVERLAAGDLVSLFDGTTQPVRWVGHRTVDCAAHPHPEKVWPVCIAADAFGAGLPARPLYLSPDHAVFVDGLLIPVRCLLDGHTVRQMRVARVRYLHVELDWHDILLAEGLPAESFLASANRGAFANGGAAMQAFPEFEWHADRWEAEGYAMLTQTGPALDAVRRKLARRAGHLAA